MSKSAQTRISILSNAFDLIYVKGYQSTSIDEVISRTNVTKGAFYYHFPSKSLMGLAVINEIVLPAMYQSFILPLKHSDKPVKDVFKAIKDMLFNVPFLKVRNGCPLSNLIQEMSALETNFSLALNVISDNCIDALSGSFKRGKKAGKIRKDINEKDVACFIVAGYGGIRNLGKQNSRDCYRGYLDELKCYLKSLQ